MEAMMSACASAFSEVSPRKFFLRFFHGRKGLRVCQHEVMTLVMTAVMNVNRSRPREELRAAIYDSAIAAFRTHGFRNVTVEQITAQAGVAKGTFFNFYRTKLDVLTDYYWRLDAVVAPWRAALDPAHPVDSLARYAGKMERLFLKEGDLFADLLSLTMSDGDLSRIDRQSGESDARQFAQFFERCRAEGTVRDDLDPRRAADLLIDIWAGAVRQWFAGRPKSSLVRIFRSKIEDVFEGFATRRAKR